LIETFLVQGEEIYLTNRARGIFKPRQMRRGVLSVKTTLPRIGRQRRYRIDRPDDGSFLYAFQGDSEANHDNQRLKEAFEDQTPFIYFHGVAEARYAALCPAYISKWITSMLQVEIQIGTPSSRWGEPLVLREEERLYRTRLAQQRVHQSAFREMVLDAYDSRCALTGLPIRSLLNAAHIFPDGHEKGVASVTNGVALSTLHHAAYDSNLIGIDPDGRIEVSDRVFAQNDGPLLELGLKALHRKTMRFPRDMAAKPDRDALAFRFEAFRAAG
jgi:putative restriction endonuclease